MTLCNRKKSVNKTHSTQANMLIGGYVPGDATRSGVTKTEEDQ